jgi:hypothetical protein
MAGFNPIIYGRFWVITEAQGAGEVAGGEHPDQQAASGDGVSALGVIRLERKYGAERLEAACTRGVRLKLYRFQSVKSMHPTGSDGPGPS